MTEKKFLDKPRAVLFDWDSTLVDSLALVHDSINYAFTKFGKEPTTIEDTKINIHQSYKDSMPLLFPDNWKEVVDTYREHYLRHNHQLKLLPSAEAVLALLKESNMYVALISNKQGNVLRNEVKMLNLEHYFDKILGGGDLENDKPDPITVFAALEKTSIKPDQHPVWFIGDSVTDMKTAHNSGCLPLFFGDDDHASERYEDCRPGFHVNDHDELYNHIKRIFGK